MMPPDHYTNGKNAIFLLYCLGMDRTKAYSIVSIFQKYNDNAPVNIETLKLIAQKEWIR